MLYFLSFYYAPKRPSPSFLYIPRKENPLSMIKYELLTSCGWCFLTKVQLHQQTGKNGPPTNPATRLRVKFLSFMRYNLFMGVNEMCVKILPLLCRLGLVLRLGSV